MHCPRCGQQQVSVEIKFCSRCGFPLGLVSELLSNGGFLPQLDNLQKKDKKLLTRNFGLKISLIWFLFVCFILVPLAAVTRAPNEVVPGLAIIGFCGALLMAALSFFFLPKDEKASRQTFESDSPQYLSGKQQQNALPPQTSQPASSFMPPSQGAWKAPETGDFVSNSVTEGTTKLLQKDE